MNRGKVFIVGAGPGDPMLITLKAMESIRSADVIFYDNLINKKLLDYAREDAELVYSGKEAGRHSLKQDEINELIIKKAKEGKKTVRLKGGDPFIFGRGGEEVSALVRKNIPFEIIPGISSAMAVPAYAGIPLTHRDYASSVAIISGHGKGSDNSDSSLKKILEEVRNFTGTIVILMPVRNIKKIFTGLIKQGRDPETPVAVIMSGTTPFQKTLTGTLGEILSKTGKSGLTSPAIVVIGEVVTLRKSLDWYERKPLFGKKVLVTSPRSSLLEINRYLTHAGSEVIELPAIKVSPVKSYEGIDKEIERIEKYHWIIFTSKNGVDIFMKRFAAKGRDIRELKGIRICTIGERTAERLRNYNINADLVPEKYTSEAIIEGLKKIDLKGKRILLPRSQNGGKALPEKLKKMGANVCEIATYKIQSPKYDKNKIKKLFRENKIDCIIFTSSSAVKNFLKMVSDIPCGNGWKKYLKQAKICAIGIVTSKTLRGFGIKTDIMPEEYTIRRMVEEMESYFKNQNVNIKM